MPVRNDYDRAAIAALFQQQSNVATHRQLSAMGMPVSTVTHRISPSGPWQRILPGVVLCHRGTPTRRELVVAAVLYSGDGAVLTGLQAVRAHGLGYGLERGQRVHTLIPNERRRVGYGYLTVERCRQLPEPLDLEGVPTAPLGKAVVDACRRIERLNDVRALAAEAVQSRRLSVTDLSDAVHAAARQRTALSRLALREMAAGVRSVAEAQARELIRELPIVQPEWNVSLHTAGGGFLATPDAYWVELAAAVEIDSMRWHLSPAAYRRTQRRQRKLVAEAGVLLLPVAPADVLESPRQFQDDVRGLVLQASRRTPPVGLVAVRRAA